MYSFYKEFTMNCLSLAHVDHTVERFPNEEPNVVRDKNNWFKEMGNTLLSALLDSSPEFELN